MNSSCLSPWCAYLQAIKKIGIERWPYRQLSTLKQSVLLPLKVRSRGDPEVGRSLLRTLKHT